jgi:hypothetical protein
VVGGDCLRPDDRLRGLSFLCPGRGAAPQARLRASARAMVTRRRPGTVAKAAGGMVPHLRCTVRKCSRCTACGTRSHVAPAIGARRAAAAKDRSKRRAIPAGDRRAAGKKYTYPRSPGRPHIARRPIRPRALRERRRAGPESGGPGMRSEGCRTYTPPGRPKP